MEGQGGEGGGHGAMAERNASFANFAVARARPREQRNGSAEQESKETLSRSGSRTSSGNGKWMRPMISLNSFSLTFKRGPDQAIARKINVSRYKESRRYIINPEESRNLKKWDALMMIVLLFMCMVSPYELAFLSQRQDLQWLEAGADWLFWCNRIVDAVFVTDMVLQFFIQYPVQTRYGVLYVSCNRAIAKNYLSTWFLVDLLSIVPFEIISLLIQAESLVRLTALRAFRLLRLLKLINLVRGIRIVNRWEVELNFSYRRMTLWGLLGTTCLAAHWISCALGMMSSIQGDFCYSAEDPDYCVQTWFSPFARDLVDKGLEVNHWRAYVASLHVTSTILVHPYSAQATNSLEQGGYTILLFVGGFLWTRVISRTTAVQTSLDRHGISYRQTMDDLTMNSDSMMISVTLQRRLRSFFRNLRDSSQRTTWLELCRRMSPALQCEVAVELHKAWLCRVPYLAGSSRNLVCELARRIQTEHYAQQETFGANFRLYVLNRGLCSRVLGVKSSMRLVSPGTVWGAEHLVFKTALLLEPNTATAITFCEVLVLPREAFEQVNNDFPENWSRIRKYFVKMVVIRGIIAFAKSVVEEQRKASWHSNGGGSPESGTQLFATHNAEDTVQLNLLGDHNSHAKRMAHDMKRRVHHYSQRMSTAIAPAPVPVHNQLTDHWKTLQDHLEACVKEQCGALFSAVEECRAEVTQVRADLEAAGVLPPRKHAAL